MERRYRTRSRLRAAVDRRVVEVFTELINALDIDLLGRSAIQLWPGSLDGAWCVAGRTRTAPSSTQAQRQRYVH
jgi:hypothetical protein